MPTSLLRYRAFCRSSGIELGVEVFWGRGHLACYWPSNHNSSRTLVRIAHVPTPLLTNFATVALALLLWFRSTRTHSTHSDPFTPPDQLPHEQPSTSSEPQPSGPEPRPPTTRRTEGPKEDVIQKLMLSPALFDPIRRPRNPIVLCHGGCSTSCAQ